jgi:DNA-binding CsgD family transcriptional regulator
VALFTSNKRCPFGARHFISKNAPFALASIKRGCEDEVVKLVADGLSNRNVAQKLGLTEHTVSNYLFRIYEKLGISSRVELVLYALKQKQG